MTASARAQINLGAIRKNFQLIKSLEPRARTMAVVKGNAYGHGLVRAAETLSDADSLAVARLSELKQLRNAGIDMPVVLLGGVVAPGDLAEAADLAATICVHNNEQVQWLEAFAGPRFDVWLKIDTGMNRLGISTEGTPAAIERLQNCNAVAALRVMSHFANADDRNDPMTLQQIERFRHVTADFAGDLSIANSGGLFGFGAALNVFASAADAGRLWIRPGIALYGVSPLSDSSAADLALSPAMTFASRLLEVKRIQAGDRVGYGGEWEATQDTILGVVAVGYGDGYSRYMPTGTPVLVNGREVPVVGNISMDLTTVDLGPKANDAVGDAAVLWGEGLPVERIANIAGTASYQLVTGLTHREAPVYIDDDA
ncbi:MAG: alanine racemase [Woeseiaceae bacterium]